MKDLPKSDELLSRIDHKPPKVTGWMDTPVEIRKGMYCYASNPKSVEYVGLPNARAWNPLDDDWQLPENWQQILHDGFKERLGRFRSFKIFMDICVRCGACADKCHFFIGTGDPKNMPVLRAELLRSVYRNDFTTAGKILGRLARWSTAHDPRSIEGMVVLPVPMLPNAAVARSSAPTALIRPKLRILGRELLNLLGLEHRLDRHTGFQLLSRPATIWGFSPMPTKICLTSL